MKLKDLLQSALCAFPEKAGRVAAPFVLLLIRVVWGVQFLQTGWGKLNNIPRTTAFFESLGIPAPELHAYLIGSLECAGGALLIAGLASRLVSAPLVGTMLVATLTAHREDFLGTAAEPVTGVDVITKFFEAAPGPFLIAALVVFAFGPGIFSVDAALKAAGAGAGAKSGES